MRIRALAGALFVIAVIAAIPYVLWIQTRNAAQPAFSGVVEADAENVGPVEASRIISIEVAQGQRVKPGDVLVRFDPSSGALDRLVNETRLREYEQSVQRYRQDQASYRLSLLENERRCRQLVREASVALEEQKMNQARDEAELKGYRAEIERLQPLVQKRLVSELDLASLRPRVDALEHTLASYAPLLGSLQTRLEQTQADLKDVSARLAETDKSARAADEAQASASVAIRDAVERCFAENGKDASVLRAVSGGVVSQVFRKTGDVVAAGDPVLRITSASGPVSIMGMLPISQIESVHVGDVFSVARAGETAGRVGALTARVESLSPEVLDFFDPYNPAPRLPVRGRRVRLSISGNAPEKLVPGETVRLMTALPETYWESVRRICRGSR